MENQDLQYPAPAKAVGAHIQSAPLAVARVNPKGHVRTAGEKKFDRLTYTTIGYIINVLLSVGAVWWVERHPAGQKLMKNFVDGTKKRFSRWDPETAEMLATKSFFLTGGFAVLLPMKWMEDAKVPLVKKWDRQIYGDKVDTDPGILQSHHDLETAPKQSWASIMGSRILALIPFYATIYLLWDRKSPLSKSTNPELAKLSKPEMKVMQAEAPEAFSKLANKGFYFDKPISWVSRKLGIAGAEIAKDAKTVETLKTLEKAHPGVIHGNTLNKPHDPMHSTMPYYFISEAITSGMVAWGVYALTRVLGPLVGKKQDVAPQGDAHVAIPTNVVAAAPAVVPATAKAPAHPAAEIADAPAAHAAHKAQAYAEAPEVSTHAAPKHGTHSGKPHHEKPHHAAEHHRETHPQKHAHAPEQEKHTPHSTHAPAHNEHAHNGKESAPHTKIHAADIEHHGAQKHAHAQLG